MKLEQAGAPDAIQIVVCEGHRHRIAWNADGARFLDHSDRATGTTCAQRVDEWRAAGVGSESVAAWIQRGIGSGAKARRWIAGPGRVLLQATVQAAVEAARDRLSAAGSIKCSTLFAPIVITTLDVLKDSGEDETAAHLKTLFGFDADTAGWAIRYNREESGDKLVESIDDLLGGNFLPADDNYAVLEELVFERAFYVASWSSSGGMTSGGVDWDGVEMRGQVYWRMRGDTEDAHSYAYAYEVSDHASREAAYRDLNEELLITHREIETGDATDDSEDDSFEPATWEQTE